MTNKQTAIKIIEKLRSNGFQALLAGGCVRDMLLARPAKDFDIATDAGPDEVSKLFRRTLKVGVKFGVVIVLLDSSQIEVATFRTETGYYDGRHPGSVKFAGAAEDASRRDFTINGMFYDPIDSKVIDYVEGQVDLKKRLIRTIGNPDDRFSEDYLRMLRAIRFSTQLDFKIEPRTFAAICRYSEKIKNISGERISAELEGILVNPNRAKGIKLLIETGLAETIFPAFSKYTGSNVTVLGHLRRKVDFPLALTAFFADCPTDFALDKCLILKLSRNQAKHLKFLLDSRGKLLNENMSLSGLRILLANPYFDDLFELQRAIQKSKALSRGALSPLIKLRRRIKALGDIEFRPKPLLNGHDLIRLGAVHGPSLGQLTQELYIAQLEGTIRTPEEAKLWAQVWLQKHKTDTA